MSSLQIESCSKCVHRHHKYYHLYDENKIEKLLTDPGIIRNRLKVNAAIENARRVLLVCDATKVARAAPVRIGHMAQINTFITDRLSSDRLRAVCAENRVQVIEACARMERSSQ